MGRVKLEIKKIENPTKRHVTYSKRKNGLIKKAYELSVLCDIDIAVIMFSPSGNLAQFSKNDRIEDILTRYADTPLHKATLTKGKFENLEYDLNESIQKLNRERELEAQQRSVQESQLPSLQLAYGDRKLQVEELQRTLRKVIMERNLFEQKARLFQHEESISLSSMNQLVPIEHELERALVQVRGRKHQLAQAEAQLQRSNKQHVLQQHSSYVQQMVSAEMVNRSGASDLSDDQTNAPNVRGSQGFQFQSKTCMEYQIKREYMDDPPTSMSIMSTSHMRETGSNSESTSSLYQGARQAQPLPWTVHGDGKPDTNFFHSTRAEPGAPYFPGRSKGQLVPTVKKEANCATFCSQHSIGT